MNAALVLPLPYPNSHGRRYPCIIPRGDLGEYKYQYAGRVPWTFHVESRAHEVPIGFVFDGASIPTLMGGLWVLTYSKAAAVVLWAAMEHDWLSDTRPSSTTSRAAAQRFKEVLLIAGARPWKVELMYRAVLYFGPQW